MRSDKLTNAYDKSLAKIELTQLRVCSMGMSGCIEEITDRSDSAVLKMHLK